MALEPQVCHNLPCYKCVQLLLPHRPYEVRGGSREVATSLAEAGNVPKLSRSKLHLEQGASTATGSQSPKDQGSTMG